MRLPADVELLGHDLLAHRPLTGHHRGDGDEDFALRLEDAALAAADVVDVAGRDDEAGLAEADVAHP